ncbi:hypothetical protein KSS87_018884 [Heliosperma pusillum]|nr:hypothetical protein KSS87_018884 [Heliosperma pusillum]
MEVFGLRHMYGMVTEAIHDYMGLSPMAFMVIVGVVILTYKIVCGMFVAADDYKAVRDMNEIYEADMRREPVQLGDVTEEELKAYDGSNPQKPLLMAIKGQIYDVSRGRMFYGPGGPYAMFAGHDATRALALMSFDTQDLTGNTEGLSESELDVLEDWELKFNEKYPKVGALVPKAAIVDDNHLETKKAV